MAKFVREIDAEILQTVSAKLSWSYNITLLDKVRSREERVSLKELGITRR